MSLKERNYWIEQAKARLLANERFWGLLRRNLISTSRQSQAAPLIIRSILQISSISRCKPRLNEEGIGDFEDVISLVDAYNLVQSNTANLFQYNDNAILKISRLGDELSG